MRNMKRGKYSRVESMARVPDKALFIGFFVLSGASNFYGLIGAMINK